MRNLKKILALVLALVMSLSLMSVAGATEFPDSDQISETYAESVDVLTGLKVFQGNKGEFKPKDNITRAEVANIIYRIVTGDVDGASVGIYADYNKFTDVPNTAWFAGCVNYCANAEYIKGRGNGKFDPYGNVTGYEALAMILRAIGYDKNGEFTGANWQIQTAATARNRGITKNIVEGTLGVAASREMVAEILCQTILVPVADYSLAFGYRTTDAVTGKENETLAKKTFKMERLEGVVTANEYASLTATSPLAAGQTTIGDKTLNVTSTLDDLGESRYVYVIPQTGTTRYDLVCSKVYDTGDNNVYDSGDAVKTVDKDTGKDNGITSLTGAEHFRNYGELTKDTSDWRIEYVISLQISEYEAKSMFYENGTQTTSSLKDLLNAANNDRADGTMTIPTAAQYAARDNATTATTPGWARTIAGSPYTYEYRKVITVGETITPTDVANIRAIFYASEHIVNGSNPYDIGEVYVGTSSKQDTDDISNKISYQQFVDTYLKDTDVTVTSNGLGNRLKIVDNNNDGVAEYVLQTVYTIGMISAVDADGKLTLDITNATFSNPECHPATRHVSDAVNYVTSSNKVINDGEGDLAVGDVVIYAVIDGNARVEKAAGETAKIDTVNRTALTTTTVDGNEYKESNVHEHSTALNHGVDGLVGNTTYSLYFDKYGNLAAYTEGANGDFVLITDGWFDSRKGGDEYAVRAFIDGSIQTVDVTANGALFIDGRLPNGGININSNNWGMLREFDKLNNEGTLVKTTVAQLRDGMLIPVDKSYLYNRQVDMLEIQNNTIPGRDFNKDGKGLVHKTNYLAGVAYTDTTSVTGLYDVRALSTTTYYFVYNYYNNNIAYNTVVRSYTGYGSVPTVNKDHIEDVYAVGTKAVTAAGETYYTADVVVVELNNKYIMNDSEQVFIPEFPVVTGNAQYEQVEMIRGNGERETLTVDLYKSLIRPYDEAGETNNGVLTRASGGAGLYFMDESDTEKGVYIIKYMTRDDISASGRYAVGMVKMNTATGAEDWTSVDLFVRNTAIDQGEHWDVDGIKQEIAKKNVTSSKYYTLAYDRNNGNAKLGDSDRINALAQNTDPDVRLDTSDTWYNETERGENNIQRNEVLVAYSGANIVYAISFNEYSAKSPLVRDAAQGVWYSCMPNTRYGAAPADTYDTEDPTSVTLYTSTTARAADVKIDDLTTANAPVDYTKWAAHNGKDACVVVTPATGNQISVNGQPFTTNPVTIELAKPVGSGDPENVTVVTLGNKTGAAPKTLTYTVSYAVADAAGKLVARGTTTEVTDFGSHPWNGKPQALDGFVKQFELTPATASVEWTWTTADGTVIKTLGLSVEQNKLTGTKGGVTVDASGVTMSEITAITAVVKNQAGQTVATYYDATTKGTADSALTTQKTTLKGAMDTFAAPLSGNVTGDGDVNGVKDPGTWGTQDRIGLATKQPLNGLVAITKYNIDQATTYEAAVQKLNEGKIQLLQETYNVAVNYLMRLCRGPAANSGAFKDFVGNKWNATIDAAFDAAIDKMLDDNWATADKFDPAKGDTYLKQVIDAADAAAVIIIPEVARMTKDLYAVTNALVYGTPVDTTIGDKTVKKCEISAAGSFENNTADFNSDPTWQDIFYSHSGSAPAGFSNVLAVALDLTKLGMPTDANSYTIRQDNQAMVTAYGWTSDDQSKANPESLDSSWKTNNPNIYYKNGWYKEKAYNYASLSNFAILLQPGQTATLTITPMYGSTASTSYVVSVTTTGLSIAPTTP